MSVFPQHRICCDTSTNWVGVVLATPAPLDERRFLREFLEPDDAIDAATSADVNTSDA